MFYKTKFYNIQRSTIMNIDECGNRVWRNPAYQLHRTDGPALETTHGSKYWYNYNKLHRLNGPAIELVRGSQLWWVHGQRHRTDGPAIETSCGIIEWWYKNYKVSKSEVVHQVCQLHLKTLLLSQTINPFCEINIAKYAL
jgi:hypothetical protein